MSSSSDTGNLCPPLPYIRVHPESLHKVLLSKVLKGPNNLINYLIFVGFHNIFGHTAGRGMSCLTDPCTSSATLLS